MRNGRPPKPTLLHHLHGTFNVTKHRDRINDPVAPGELKRPPAHLSKPQARRFREVLAHAPRQILRQADIGMVASYVIAESVVAEANMTPMWSSCRRRRTPWPRPSHDQAPAPLHAAAPEDTYPDAEDVGALDAGFELLPAAASEIWPGSSAPLPG
jgi:hypothetical protein